jgi:hypothetical protein
VRWTERFGVNKGTDWDSGLAQNTEQLAHAKIAVGHLVCAGVVH